MECFLHNKCVINVKTRKLCKKCRLDKCYAIGMIKVNYLLINVKFINEIIMLSNWYCRNIKIWYTNLVTQRTFQIIGV